MGHISLIFSDERMANITMSVNACSDRHGVFYGEKGYLVVDNITNPMNICVYGCENRLLFEQRLPQQKYIYEYEISECVEAIRSRKLEPPSMPHSDSVFLIELMDCVRSQWKLYYPGESAQTLRPEPPRRK